MLKAFILMPFIFAFLLGVSFFLKNPKTIRRISKLFYFIQFFSCATLALLVQEKSFSFLNIDFLLDKSACILLFLVSFIFFLFSIISKTFIKKLHRVFYSISFLLLGLVNFLIINDNILIFLVILFWIFLINYLLSTLFSDKNAKKDIAIQLSCDLICLMLGASLILKEFARFFVINEIDFSFSILVQYLYKIDDVAIILAFFGFLVILSRLFNFIPFCAQNLSNSSKINPFIFYLNSVGALIAGSCLFVRCYKSFDYLFYQYQDEIAIFLLVNFAIYILLILGQKKLFKFLNSIIIVNIIIAIFSMFSFEDESCANFIYYIIALSLAYSLSAFVFMILEQKFKTDDIEDIKKIADKSKLSQFFIAFSLLNFAPIPLLAIFSAQANSFLIIFSTEYEGVILNIIPYCLIFGVMFVCLAVFTMLHKIIIDPIQKAQISSLFCNHQKVVCWTLVFSLILFAFLAQNVFRMFTVFGLD